MKDSCKQRKEGAPRGFKAVGCASLVEALRLISMDQFTAAETQPTCMAFKQVCQRRYRQKTR
jgi:hypothetical protein